MADVTELFLFLN